MDFKSFMNTVEETDSYTSRLLIEAVTFRSGTDGLLEEAKRNA